MKKTALLAIALSPFILNAQLQEEVYDSSYEDEQEESEYVADRDALYDGEQELADASDSDDQDSYTSTSAQDSECHSPYHRMHVGVRHTEARGVGYTDGYTTIEGFGIYDHNPYFMPFLDLRGHVFNSGKVAGNVGIGERTVIPCINHIFGLYLYYDVRQSNHRLHVVNQLSPGIELLGKRMEYRMNGYFPVGRDKSRAYSYEFNSFDGNNILLKYKQKFAMTGGDAEVGVHITQSTKYDLYAAAGPYFFSSKRASSWGGKTRLLGRYKEYVSLEASYSFDHLFKSVVQGTVAFNYPFGRKLRRKDRNCPQQNDLMLSRAAFAPYRFEIPVVKRKTRKTAAINPATGKPWQVWFVNNTSSSAGTFKSPFPTLLQAQNASSPNDMIYVFPGDGTTTGMNMGIDLQDGQTFFGSGISHKIQTTKGQMKIPAFSKTAPSITNTAGSVVTLGNGNEVSGMNIFVQTINAKGIDGTAGIIGAIIDSNSISSSVQSHGIRLFGSGNFSVTNNQMSSSGVSLTFGTQVQFTGVTNVNVSNNVSSGYGTSVQVVPLTGGNPVSLSANIVDNTYSNFGTNGISANFQVPVANMKIAGNTVNNTVGTSTQGAIAFSVNNVVSGDLLVDSNMVTSTSPTATNNIFIQIGSSSLGMAITNNNVVTGTVAGATAFSIQAVSGASTINANIANNQFSVLASTGNGIVFTNGGTITSICASITNNQGVGASAVNGISLASTLPGVFNIDNFSGNQAPNISITGNSVNLVAPGFCSQ